MPRKSKPAERKRDIAAEQFAAANNAIHLHPLFARLATHARIYRIREFDRCPPDGWAVVATDGAIYANASRRGEPDEWLYVLAHCLLHLGFGHLDATRINGRDAREWATACDYVVARFLADLKLGRPPADIRLPRDFPIRTEESLVREFTHVGISAELTALGVAGRTSSDMIVAEPSRWRDPTRIDWSRLFGEGLADAARSAVNVAAGVETRLGVRASSRSAAMRAREWFISSYPLLGALASAFAIIEDPTLCRRLDISVAAIDMQTREIYINPAAGLDEQECRFVIGHELLHAGLRHDVRCDGRDPYLWNVACDYVINGWLVEMAVGAMPALGLLYDPTLTGESAESIYDRIVTDRRRLRRLATLRGNGLGDILSGTNIPSPGDPTDLDAFCRRCLGEGLRYHDEQGRGLLPSGLVEEINALAQPPIPWDVALARWFDAHFPPLERRRSYARPSRRQAATPDIPRPSLTPPLDADSGRTFGVVLDTSGSMDRQSLAKALGAIASYAVARDVPAVRVIFCDVATYDQGYLAPTDIAGRVQVRGRGGTILQPAIDLLERAEDFPKDGPLLIITDGYCDHLRIRSSREHAYLLPSGHRLPFAPKGELFRV